MLWSLLRLLAKHDGVLDGSGGDESAAELLATMRRGEGAAAAAAAAASPLARPQPTAEEQLAATARLEALLLVGERDAACEHAMASGLWADALLLSSHMDAETWRAVMVRFASQNLAPGSPLRTLYSLFAGAGTAVFDEDAPAAAPDWRGGAAAAAPPPGGALGARWRSNLAMMLANPTAGDTEVIARLGDQLKVSHGAVAAHCCYMLAELPLEIAPDSSSARLELLGADRRAPGK